MQKLWSIPYVLELVYQDSQKKPDVDNDDVNVKTREANRRKKLKRTFYEESRQRDVRDIHATIWPGIALPEDLPIRGTDGHDRGRMPERTAPTSVLVSMLAFELFKEGKRLKTVMRAHEVLKSLVATVSQKGDWTIVLAELRFFNNNACLVHTDGSVDGKALWGSGRCSRSDEILQLWSQALETCATLSI